MARRDGWGPGLSARIAEVRDRAWRRRLGSDTQADHRDNRNRGRALLSGRPARASTPRRSVDRGGQPSQQPGRRAADLPLQRANHAAAGSRTTLRQIPSGSGAARAGRHTVYRREDDPEATHRNDQMFRSAVDVLHGGDAIQIYPEGRSHSEAHLVAFRTGTARIALQAEEGADWGLGLSIVPVGITYAAKELARPRSPCASARRLGAPT